MNFRLFGKALLSATLLVAGFLTTVCLIGLAIRYGQSHPVSMILTATFALIGGFTAIFYYGFKP